MPPPQEWSDWERTWDIGCGAEDVGQVSGQGAGEIAHLQ